MIGIIASRPRKKGAPPPPLVPASAVDFTDSGLWRVSFESNFSHTFNGAWEGEGEDSGWHFKQIVDGEGTQFTILSDGTWHENFTATNMYVYIEYSASINTGNGRGFRPSSNKGPFIIFPDSLYVGVVAQQFVTRSGPVPLTPAPTNVSPIAIHSGGTSTRINNVKILYIGFENPSITPSEIYERGLV